MYKVTINNQKSFNAPDNKVITLAALDENVVLDHSCLNGKCGICKAIILKGETKVVKSEEGLSKEEKAAGSILACCRVPISDLKIDADDLTQFANFKPKIFPARIDSVELVSSNTLKAVIRLHPNAKFNFIPGQYLKLISPEGFMRSYSIANAKRADKKLELLVGKVDAGILSNYWFNEAKKNDLIRIEGPFGTFVLRDTKLKKLLFLATGTGIAPIKSMIEDLSQSGNLSKYDSIIIYWGLRRKKDIFWSPKANLKKIKFFPILSREKNLNIKQGYVQDHLEGNNLCLDDYDIYACGSKNMIDEVICKLNILGVSQGQLYSDCFLQSS